jgi:type II secretory pathway pseudopilin PulG
VAIIAVLVALLIPTVKSGIRSSMAAKGTSNLRQLAQAQMQFAAENNGCYTSMYTPINNCTWQRTLGPYLGIDPKGKPPNAFYSDLRMDPKSVYNMPDSKPASQRTTGATSIGMNSWMITPVVWDYRTLAVPKPSQTILLAEMPRETGTEGVKPTSATNIYQGFNRSGRTRPLMVFCDGHVEALNPASLADNPADRPPGQPNLWRWW